MSKALNQFKPDYIVCPGEILEETLEARGMKKSELAERCGRSEKMISQIISGQAPITAETAIQFERVLGVSANIWNNLEAKYRLAVAKTEQQDGLNQQIAWAKRFPLKYMTDLGFIQKPKSNIDKVEKLLDFFGVANSDAWEERCARICVNFRKSPSFESAPESVTAWLRMGQILAQDIQCEPFNKDYFIQALKNIRSLTLEKNPDVFIPALTNICSDVGVAIVIVPELPKTHLSGAARWLTKDKAIIQLSFRYKSNDHFWFTFFHESGHILKHGKKEIFIDDDDGYRSDKEKEADLFACSTLIPTRQFNSFVRKRSISRASIIKFANEVNIAPGIVVGQLQHYKYVPYNRYNDLKVRFRWVGKDKIIYR